MFSHFGAVEAVPETIDSAETELRLWVETVRGSYAADDDLDHAVAMGKEKVVSRYKPLPPDASEEAAAVMDVLGGPEANVGGSMHALEWLERVEKEEAEVERARKERET